MNNNNYAVLPNTHTNSEFQFSLGIMLFVYIFVTVATLIAYAMIIKKTGNSACLGIILSLIPIVNWVYLFYLAFSTWPIEKELERLKNAAHFEKLKNSKDSSKE